MSNEEVVGVYIIQNKDTLETYIGSGVLQSRKKTHKYLLENDKHWNKKLQAAYNNNSNFDFLGVPIDDNVPQDEKRSIALQIEQDLINYFWGNPLLKNIAKDVEKPMIGFKHSEETKEKNRQATLSKWQDPEYREKVTNAMSESWKNLPEELRTQYSEASRQRMLNRYASLDCSPTKGQKRSEDFCNKNSDMVKSKWQDPEYRENQRIGREGKHSGPKRKVIVDNIEYETMTDAALAIGITVPGLSYRCNANTFPTYRYI